MKKYIDEQYLADVRAAVAYPINSIYISSVNSNPSALFGGEWVLENKSFAPFEDSKSDGTYLNHDTTNCSDSSLALRRNGQTISLRISITPTIDLADTTITLGQLNLSV